MFTQVCLTYLVSFLILTTLWLVVVVVLLLLSFYNMLYSDFSVRYLGGKSAGLLIERLQVQVTAGTAEEFSSPELTLCADSFGVRFATVLPQWRIKDPNHSAKSAGGRLHLGMRNTFNPMKSKWADYTAV